MKKISVKEAALLNGCKTTFKHALLYPEFSMIRNSSSNHFNILIRLALFQCHKRKRSAY